METNIMNYLSEKEFSVGASFCFNDQITRYSRLEYLVKMSKGKRIIHLGACDHISSIPKKIEQNIWLHKLLCEVAEDVIGVDINKEAIEYCNTLGITNIEFANILESKELEACIMKNLRESSATKFDYIVAGEILEHVDNPVEFLQTINEKYCDLVEGIIITVPNALSTYNCETALKQGSEVINTDHRYWFTPFTIAKVAVRAGLEIQYVELCDIGKRRKKEFYKGRILPLGGNTVALVAKLKK